MGNRLKSVARGLNMRRHISGGTIGTIDRVLQFSNLFNEHQDEREKLLPLEDMIGTFTHRQCSDPRDQVYGLQALVRADNRLSPDYQKDADEVFIDCAKAILSKQGGYVVGYVLLDSLDSLRRRMGLASFDRYDGLRIFLESLVPGLNFGDE